MAVLKCKMCGGDMEIAADKTFGTCEYCGSTMTLPKVSDDQRAAAFNRGNYFRRTGEFDKALAVYERIVAEDDTDAEAHWCCALCRFGIEYVEDPVTYEWLPTCHRASFDSFLEDVDYKAAVEYSDGITKRQYQKDAAKIAEVQKGILATSQNEEPFDVFICYKESDENGERTRDSLMAQDIYYQLTEQGKRVFFARITLEDKAGTEYEPYIFAALNSSKVMIVVGSKAEYFNAVWVKNEWSRFLSMMKRDRSKLLLPCYKDMDPYDLPEALSVLQSYDMSKIGFIQDLLRGINKVLSSDAPKTTTVKETVVVQNENGANVKALLQRGNNALEDKEWDKATEFFNRVLDINAECAEAYLGLLLAGYKVTKLENLRDQADFPSDKNWTRAKQYASDDLLSVIENKEAKHTGYVNQEEAKKQEKQRQAEDWREEFYKKEAEEEAQYQRKMTTAAEKLKQDMVTWEKHTKELEEAKIKELNALQSEIDAFEQNEKELLAKNRENDISTNEAKQTEILEKIKSAQIEIENLSVLKFGRKKELNCEISQLQAELQDKEREKESIEELYRNKLENQLPSTLYSRRQQMRKSVNDKYQNLSPKSPRIEYERYCQQEKRKYEEEKRKREEDKITRETDLLFEQLAEQEIEKLYRQGVCVTAMKKEHIRLQCEIKKVLYLADGKKKTVSEIQNESKILKEISNMRLSTELRPLIEAGSVDRTEERGKAYFTLNEDYLWQTISNI